VRPGQYQLGRPAVAESGNPSGLGSRDGSRRGRGDGEPGPGDIPHEGQGAPGSHGAAGHREPRSLPGLELHHQPTRYGTAELIRVNENLELVLGWPLKAGVCDCPEVVEYTKRVEGGWFDDDGVSRGRSGGPGRRGVRSLRRHALPE